MAETKVKKENSSFLGGIRTYLTEVRNELNKVSWPSREDVMNLTRIVLIVTAITSVGLGLLSIGLTIFLDQFGLDNPLILAILFVAITLGTWWQFRKGESKSY